MRAGQQARHRSAKHRGIEREDGAEHVPDDETVAEIPLIWNPRISIFDQGFFGPLKNNPFGFYAWAEVGVTSCD